MKKFDPHYQITPSITQNLERVERVQERVLHAPLTAHVLKSLRETARLFSTHYSTMIEGNRLSAEQVEEVIKHKGHFPGRERDEAEVRGYYAALAYVEELAKNKVTITESIIQTLHALVMGDGAKTVKPTPYRDGQNVIRDGRTRAIVYLPPQAEDVPLLMRALVDWIEQSKNTIPTPIIASIVHYEYATIHPYYDGNGRTARLLATLVLHLGGYGLKGLYSLEEYYARNLGAYYDALSIGPSHNYYLGRAEADITPWITYFCEGMAISFENVIKYMEHAAQEGQTDQAALLSTLDPKKRKALDLFLTHDAIRNEHIQALFGYSSARARALCKQWIDEGFLVQVGREKKGIVYALSDTYKVLKS
jgi:Fic family protein